MSSRRTRTQIYLDILRAVQQKDGRIKKTHIVYKANLTHSRLKEYMDHLTDMGFIERKKSGHQTFFSITDEGKRFLSEVNKLKKISEAFGVPL